MPVGCRRLRQRFSSNNYRFTRQTRYPNFNIFVTNSIIFLNQYPYCIFPNARLILIIWVELKPHQSQPYIFSNEDLCFYQYNSFSTSLLSKVSSIKNSNLRQISYSLLYLLLRSGVSNLDFCLSQRCFCFCTEPLQNFGKI